MCHSYCPTRGEGGQHQKSTNQPPPRPGSEVNQLPSPQPGSEVNHLPPTPGSEVNHPPRSRVRGQPPNPPPARVRGQPPTPNIRALCAGGRYASYWNTFLFNVKSNEKLSQCNLKEEVRFYTLTPDYSAKNSHTKRIDLPQNALACSCQNIVASFSFSSFVLAFLFDVGECSG